MIGFIHCEKAMQTSSGRARCRPARPPRWCLRLVRTGAHAHPPRGRSCGAPINSVADVVARPAPSGRAALRKSHAPRVLVNTSSGVSSSRDRPRIRARPAVRRTPVLVASSVRNDDIEVRSAECLDDLVRRRHRQDGCLTVRQKLDRCCVVPRVAIHPQNPLCMLGGLVTHFASRIAARRGLLLRQRQLVAEAVDSCAHGNDTDD
jgi:hypothetical protein